jgi:hypothetical protein
MPRPLVALVIVSFFAGAWWAALGPSAQAHCQMPCGIFDDPASIAKMREDAQTIRKAVTQMQSMDQNPRGDAVPHQHPLLDFNQSTRWVMTKNQQAQNIQEVVSAYFLTQRVKAVPAGEAGHDTYVAQLAGFHAILVAAMKCKQTADLASVDALDAAIAGVAGWYP